MATANITPTAPTDGIIYSAAVPLTTSEADLYGGTGVQAIDPTPIPFGAAVIAVVQLSINGFITGNSTYVVMQTDLGDGTWIDCNWLFWNQVQGSATFVFCNGIAGVNTFQQTRNSGQVPQPQASGSNQVVLGGRIRFVGRTVMTGGSSIAPGATAMVTVSIRYKILPLR